MKALTTMTCDILKPEKLSFAENVLKKLCSNVDPSKKKPYDLIIVVDDCYCLVILSNSHIHVIRWFQKDTQKCLLCNRYLIFYTKLQSGNLVKIISLKFSAVFGFLHSLFAHLQYWQQPTDLILHGHTLSRANFLQVHGSGKLSGSSEELMLATIVSLSKDLKTYFHCLLR